MRASSSTSQQPGPEAAEATGPDLPGFRATPRWPGPASRDQAQAQATVAAAGGGSGSGSGSSEPGPRTPTDDDRPPPPPPRPFAKGTAKAFEQIAGGALKAVGGLVNQRLAVDDADESFLPDDDDEQAIAPPVGRLMARRLPVKEGADLTEMEDIGAALVGLVAWALKGATSMWQARRDRKRARRPLEQSGAVVYQGGPGDGQDHEEAAGAVPG